MNALIDCQQIGARIDVLAKEIAWLTAALDIQFKRTADTRARLVLFPPPTRSPENLQLPAMNRNAVRLTARTTH